MRELTYGSGEFLREAQECLDANEDFRVRVPASHRHRQVIGREVRQILYDQGRPNLLRDLMDKFRTQDFYFVFADAVHNRKYAFTFEDDADLVLNFRSGAGTAQE